jgi:uncharacterized protein (DUF1330 family)
MATYVIADIRIHDSQTYERYKQLAPSSIAKYGGRYAVRGGATETLEGDWNPERIVILEFPSADAARKWWNSPEYTEARGIRQQCSTGRLLLVDGPSLNPTA